ncbi:MAG: HAMP domain-containing sensor histidine kinase [Nibricoccus sp.]
MTKSVHPQLAEFGIYLSGRREVILLHARWRAQNDPVGTVVNSLTRTQFRDELPLVLSALEQQLRASSSPTPSTQTANAPTAERKHGLHRWQQGYQIRELLQEWHHLHQCLLLELAEFTRLHSETTTDFTIAASREIADLIHAGIDESCGVYVRLHQYEAAGRLNELRQTLDEQKRLEQSRAELIRQAVHDLRGELQPMTGAARILSDAGTSEDDRRRFLGLVQQGTDLLGSMLGRLIEFARLEAGQEKREIAPFDAAALVKQYCASVQSVAHAHGLYLKVEAPANFHVDGDEPKTRRILQNLVLNALKYTTQGGVTVRMGDEPPHSWWLMVADTGPGIAADGEHPFAQTLKKATVDSQKMENYTPPELEKGSQPNLPPPAYKQMLPSEGVGLSIVKRLCELLDAKLELASAPGKGTTFRVIFPRAYPSKKSA